MKKIIAITAGLLLLGACGTKTVYLEATTTAPPTTKYVPEPTYTDEQMFIDSVENLVGPLYGVEDTAIETGYALCTFLRNGGTFEELEPIYNESFDSELIAAVTVASVLVFCPDMEQKMNDYTGGY
jgi:hypothetical protein